MATVEALVAREILDSRGNPTVEVEVALRANGMLAEEIDFKSVTLVNASITTPGGDDLPEESVTFAFDQYTLIPKPE